MRATTAAFSTAVTRALLAAAVYLATVPGAARGQDLARCDGLSWPYRASLISVEVSGMGSAELGDPLDVRISVEGGDVASMTAGYEADELAWVGYPGRPVKIGEVDLQPKLAGYVVTGPMQCRYRRIGDACSAWFQFEAVPLAKLGVQVDPPNKDGLHLPAGASSATARQPQASCLPSRPSYRRITETEEQRTSRGALLAALAADRLLAPFAVDVEGDASQVVLSGLVKSSEAKDRAEQLANQHTAGRRVLNALQPTSLYDGVAVFDKKRSTLPVGWTADATAPIEFELSLNQDLPASYSHEELQSSLARAHLVHSSTSPQPVLGQRVGELVLKNELENAKARFLEEVETLTLTRLPW